MTRSLSARTGAQFEVSRVTSKLKLVERTIALSGTHVVVLEGDVLKRTIEATQVERVSLQRGAPRTLLLLRVLPTTPPSPDVLLSVPSEGVKIRRATTTTYCAPATFAQEIVAAIQRTRPDFPCVAPGVSLQAVARLAHGPYAKITVSDVETSSDSDSDDTRPAQHRRRRLRALRQAERRRAAGREEGSETESDSESEARRRRRSKRA